MIPKLSLVMATLGRSTQVQCYLETLLAQSFADWELIIVDQNQDDRIAILLKNFNDSRISHITSKSGAARARNAGIRCAVGAFIAFPDDDCWYPDKDFLSRVFVILVNRKNIDFISGATADPDHGCIDKWLDSTSPIKKSNVWFTTVCYTLYFRRSVIEKIGGFDERLGVGAGTLWGSGEETDFVLQALSYGFRGTYEPSLITYHPNKGVERSDGYLLRSCMYAMGAGAVIRKNKLPFSTAIYFSARSFFGAMRSHIRGDRFDTSRYLVVLFGRVIGWFAWQQKSEPVIPLPRNN